jgi:hypothetical protein
MKLKFKSNAMDEKKCFVDETFIKSIDVNMSLRDKAS